MFMFVFFFFFNPVDYQYRKVDSDTSDEFFSYSGLWVAQSVLTVVGKRGSNGKYDCRVKTATDLSPVLISSVEVTVNGKYNIIYFAHDLPVFS